MTRQGLLRALSVGRRGVCVLCAPCPYFPSHVIEVTILRGLRVTVEYNAYGQEDGGPRYVADYCSVDALIDDVERFLNRGISQWENHTATGRYPEEPEGWTGLSSLEEDESFVGLVASGMLRPNENYRQTSSYWQEVEGSK